MMKHTATLFILLALLLLFSTSTYSVGEGPWKCLWGNNCTGGGGDAVLVANKDALETAASDTNVENKVIVVTDEISSSTFTGTLTAPATADSGDTDTISDATYDFSAVDGPCGANCDGKIVCIIDGTSSVAGPEGDCREITGSVDGAFDVTVAFNKAIVAGTYYSIVDPIKIAPPLDAQEQSTLRINCGDEGFFSSGGVGAPAILQISGENFTNSPGWTDYEPQNRIIIENCKFEGNHDQDSYDVAILVTNISSTYNPLIELNGIRTYKMSRRNADPQTLRTGPSVLYAVRGSVTGLTNLFVSDSILAAQVPVHFRNVVLERAQLHNVILADENFDDDFFGDVAWINDGGDITWSNVKLEYLNSLVFGPTVAGASHLNWVGGWWFFPKSIPVGVDASYGDKAVVGASSSTLNSTAQVTAVDSSTTLEDNSESWTDDEHNDRWVWLRPGESDEEWRKITDTSDVNNTITVANAWTVDPAVGNYYKIFEWWDRAFFILNQTVDLQFAEINFVGAQTNVQDPIIHVPFIFSDSTSTGEHVFAGSIANQGCGITGSGGGGSAGNHTLITASESNTTAIQILDLMVRPGFDTVQVSSACNDQVIFGPSVDYGASLNGFVNVEGDLYTTDSNGATNVSVKSCGTMLWSSSTPNIAQLTDSYQSLLDNAGSDTPNDEDDFIVPGTATINNLDCEVDVAPGAGDIWDITVQTGTPGSLADSAVTCQIAGTETECTPADVTNVVEVSAREAVMLEISGAAGGSDPAAATMTCRVCMGR